MNLRTTAFLAITALAILLFAIGCPESDAISDGANQTKSAVSSDPAAIIWDKDLEGFRSWELMPGTTERMTGRGWHTEFATIRGNALALEAVAKGAEEMPVGAILLKDNFDETGKLVNIVVMKRREDGWFWAQYREDGTVELSGPDLESCISCHGMAPNDRAFTWKKEVPSAD